MNDTLLLFIIYGFLGWVVEVLYVGFQGGGFYNRGFLHMTFLPIYAFGAIAITLLLQGISNVAHVYILGVIVTSVLEYITSYIMEKMFHTRWWDYSTYKYNINGRVCLKNSLGFGVLSVIVIFGINPFAMSYIELANPTFKEWLVYIFMAIIMLDFTYTLHSVSNLPIRDIRIITGRVKAFKAGKLRDLEELLEELSQLDDRVIDCVKTEIKEVKQYTNQVTNEVKFYKDIAIDEVNSYREIVSDDLKAYTEVISKRYDLRKLLVLAILVLFAIGIIFGKVLLFQLVALLIVIGCFTIFYNNR